jgi:predicted ribosome-associated RNA-binding protein Tma20
MAGSRYALDSCDRSTVMAWTRRKEKLNFVIVDGEPVLFRQRDGPYFPLLRTLHKCEERRRE